MKLKIARVITGYTCTKAEDGSEDVKAQGHYEVTDSTVLGTFETKEEAEEFIARAGL